MVDMHLYRVALGAFIPAVETLLQLILAQHPAALADQLLQQLVFVGGEFDRLPLIGDLLGFGIDKDIAILQYRLRLPLAATNQGAQAGVELLQGEGLDHVVVGAGIEADHPIVQRIAGGEDQHRQFVSFTPQLAQQAEAIDVGQVEIEDQGGELVALEGCQSGQPLLQPVHRIAAMAQCILHTIPQHHIIFYQQDPHSFLPVCWVWRSGSAPGRAVA